MIASPLRLRSALRAAGLAAVLVPEDSPEHRQLSAAVDQLQEAWVAGSTALRSLADADPAGLAPVPGIADLARVWAAGVPEWPASLVPDHAWLRAYWQFQRLRTFCPDADSLDAMTLGATQAKLACLCSLAAMHRLEEVAPSLSASPSAMARAVLVMLGAECADRRAIACQVAAAGRDLAPLVPQASLDALLDKLLRSDLSDSAALAAVRDEIGKVGDKAHGWLLQAVAAILEGAPPAAGLDAL